MYIVRQASAYGARKRADVSQKDKAVLLVRSLEVID